MSSVREWVHHRDEAAVLRLEHTGNGFAQGDAAGADDAEVCALGFHEAADFGSRQLLQLNALMVFTSAPAISVMFCSVYTGKAKQVKVCVSCQRALGTSTCV